MCIRDRVICTSSKQVDLIREALCISTPEVADAVESVMIGMSAEHGLPRGGPGKQDHIRSALEFFEIESVVHACLLDDTEESVSTAKEHGAAAVLCPLRVGDDVVGKQMLAACAELVGRDPEEFCSNAAAPDLNAEIPEIQLPERTTRVLSKHDPIPSMGMRLAPRSNQFGYKSPQHSPAHSRSSSPRQQRDFQNSLAVKNRETQNQEVSGELTGVSASNSPDPAEAAEVIDATGTSSRNERLRNLQQRLASQEPRYLTKSDRIALELRVVEVQKMEQECKPQVHVPEPVSVGGLLTNIAQEMMVSLSRSPRASPQSTPQPSRHPSPLPSPRAGAQEEQSSATNVREIDWGWP
eukprot:TRINITY_DN3150_c0_g1_i4.p1 TRINITY_DN3150_c0_g1~~TRINITY_DN3150_c0_g1_i4.p1  ORF type:complete len:353 (+),score=73.84 TRINITY_DN3150_c0_g1_i4:125-1183(+)